MFLNYRQEPYHPLEEHVIDYSFGDLARSLLRNRARSDSSSIRYIAFAVSEYAVSLKSVSSREGGLVAAVIENILMEPAKVRTMSAGIWVIDALLAPQKCRALVRCASLAGFADAHQRLAGRHNAEAFVKNTGLATRLEAELLSCGFHADL